MQRTPQQPVPFDANRLSQMEDLMLEIRHEQDLQLKRITALQVHLEELTQMADLASKALRRLKRAKTSRLTSHR